MNLIRVIICALALVLCAACPTSDAGIVTDKQLVFKACTLPCTTPPVISCYQITRRYANGGIRRGCVSKELYDRQTIGREYRR